MTDSSGPTPVAPGTYCVKCLAPTDLSVFLRNDHYCDPCNEADETYPLASPNHFTESKDE